MAVLAISFCFFLTSCDNNNDPSSKGSTSLSGTTWRGTSELTSIDLEFISATDATATFSGYAVGTVTGTYTLENTILTCTCSTVSSGMQYYCKSGDKISGTYTGNKITLNYKGEEIIFSKK